MEMVIKVGKPIPGSKYVRAYCSKCEEPIRVKKTVFNEEYLCEDHDKSISPPELIASAVKDRHRRGLRTEIYQS